MTSILLTPSVELNKFFREHDKVAIAFSGGVDSSYLAHAANEAGADFTCYYVKSHFQPRFELEDAMRLADEIGFRMVVIEADILSDERIAGNPSDRCYYCKNRIMNLIRERASRDGYSLICDGTNASDDLGDRPGMRALNELGIRSPLRECAMSKDEVRRLSCEAGLFTWDKPAYACLATRIPIGQRITPSKLDLIENAEYYLTSLGFRDFRIRLPEESHARIELSKGDKALYLAKKDDIVQELGKFLCKIEFEPDAR